MTLQSFVSSLAKTWTAPASAPAGCRGFFRSQFARRGVASIGVRIQTLAGGQCRRTSWASAGVAFSSSFHPAPAWAADGRHGAAHLALVAGTAVVIVLFVILPLFLRGRS